VIGQSVGVAVAGGVFSAFGGAEVSRALRHGSHAALAGPAAAAFVRGMRGALTSCAAVALCASIVAAVRGRE
jgi:hypothetical protein